jgi:hypothetical protein
MNYFNATSTSSVSEITCTFDCKTAETCLNQILDCGDQMLNVLENGAPQGGETLAYLLDTMLSAANTGIGMPSNVIQAVATELGLPYYTVFLGATALVGAAGYGFYNTLGGGTTQNNNQTQSQVAHGGSVVNNIVFSDAMLKTIKNQNDGQTNTKKKLSASD